MMGTTSKSLMTESEFRRMSHKQLLAYAIQHIAESPLEISTNPPSEDKQELTPCPSGHLKRKAKATEKGESKKMERKSKKIRKEFTMGRYGQRMIALKLNYQGWKFHGFVSQTTTKNAVEDHLFAALLKTRLIESRETCDYSRAGRTDNGVSALGQVVGLWLRSAVVPPSTGKQELDYVKMINSALPEGMRVMAWSPVCDGTISLPRVHKGDPESIQKYWENVANGNTNALVDESNAHNKTSRNCSEARRPGEKFSARFDAIFRSYKYFFARSTLDLKAMSKAATLFQGRHDFRNFCRFDDNVSNFERLLHTVEIRLASDDSAVRWDSAINDYDSTDPFAMYYIFVQGQAFLWNQVRCMAAVLFDVGRKLEEPSIVEMMLADASNETGLFSKGRPQYRLASPTPLLLSECAYPATVLWFGGSSDNSKSVLGDGKPTSGNENQVSTSFRRADAHLGQCWASLAAQCAILRTMLQDNDKFMAIKEVQPNSQNCLLETDAQNRDGLLATVVDSEVTSGGSTVEQKLLRRSLLIGADCGSHVPYRLRNRDDPISQKLERAQAKRQQSQLHQPSKP